MDIAFRPARSEDLDTAARIVQSAYNDLRTRHGLAATIPLRPPLFQEFCLAECPEGLWIAEAGGRACRLRLRLDAAEILVPGTNLRRA